MPAPPPTPTRLLIVLPTWVGDAVMATPALRLLRERLPGAFIGALCRPPVDTLLAGLPLVDELHVQARSGLMTPKHAASKVRARRYDAALLLTNSFSTALTARLAFIPRRVGYDRDNRGMLLTQRLRPPRTPDGSWRIVPAVDYYHAAAESLLDPGTPPLDPPAPTRADRAELQLPPTARLELARTPADDADANATLGSARVDPAAPLAILNPGGNNPAKRWPADRYAALADHLARTHGLTVLLNGSPPERDLCADIAGRAQTDPVVLPDHAHTIRGLKSLTTRARIMVTNDTGPRHIAAAFDTPCVALFGPTDARWTTIPAPRETILLADPDLPPDQSANNNQARCAIERIGPGRVVLAVDQLLG